MLPGRAFHVALSFDDGPHPEHTPRILDGLGALGLSATFFAVGEHAARHGALIQRIVSEGHDLGNHGHRHLSARRASMRDVVEDARRGRRVLEDLSGRPVRLFRPPRGELTLSLLRALWSHGHTVALWNVDAMDGATPTRHAMIRWVERYRPRTGDVILMHDDQAHSAAALPTFGALAADGMRFVTMSHYAFSDNGGHHDVARDG